MYGKLIELIPIFLLLLNALFSVYSALDVANHLRIGSQNEFNFACIMFIGDDKERKREKIQPKPVQIKRYGLLFVGGL